MDMFDSGVSADTVAEHINELLIEGDYDGLNFSANAMSFANRTVDTLVAVNP